MGSRDIEAVLKLKDELSKKINVANKSLTKLNRTVEAQQKKLDRIGKNTSFLNLAKSIVGANVAMAAFRKSVTAIEDFTEASIDAAARAEEIQNLFDVSFDSMAADAEDWAQRTQAATGVNDTTLKEFSGTLYNMVSAMGFAKNEAYSLGTGFTELALDTASFFNLPFDVAFQKIQAGLSGEAEPLKRLGILVTENAMNQLEWVKTIKEAGGALTEQQKVVARAELIQRGLSNAQGDLVRTQDSWTNQTRLTAEAWVDFLEVMGGFLTESKTLGFVLAFVTDTINGMSDSVTDNASAFDTWVNTSLTGTLKVLSMLGASIGLVITGLGKIGTTVAAAREKFGVFSGVSQDAANFAGSMGESLTGVGDSMLDAAAKSEQLIANLELVAQGHTITTQAMAEGAGSMADAESSADKLRAMLASLAENATNLNGSARLAVGGIDAASASLRNINLEAANLTNEVFPAFSEGFVEVAETMQPQFMQLEAAYARMGITSRAESQATLAQLQADYNTITNSATASAEARLEAEKKLEEYKREMSAESTQFSLDQGIALMQGTSTLLSQIGGQHKGFAIAGAVIDTAAAVTKTMAQWGWPLGIPFAAAAGVAGAIQIAKIKSSDPGGFAEGTANLDFQNFGSETPTALHGREAVIPQGGGHALAQEIASAMSAGGGSTRAGMSGAMNVSVHVDARGSVFDAASEDRLATKIGPAIGIALRDNRGSATTRAKEGLNRRT